MDWGLLEVVVIEGEMGKDVQMYRLGYKEVFEYNIQHSDYS